MMGVIIVSSVFSLLPDNCYYTQFFGKVNNFAKLSLCTMTFSMSVFADFVISFLYIFPMICPPEISCSRIAMPLFRHFRQLPAPRVANCVGFRQTSKFRFFRKPPIPAKQRAVLTIPGDFAIIEGNNR